MKSILTLEDHVALNEQRWLMPLLADVAAHRGARFVELVHRLKVSRDSLARSLETAVANGWLARNTGYGHPLRPEYVLTDAGRRLASGAQSLMTAQAEVGLSVRSLTRWSMPVVYVIRGGEERFSQIARELPQATPRAISQGLQALTTHGMVDREVYDSRPPSSRYRLTAGGLLLANAA